MARLGLLCALLGLAGCVVESHPSTGDLSLGWTFLGADCASAGVASVSVQLFDAGGAVVANDHLACSSGGISYKALNLGNYTAALDGISSGGARLYSATAGVQVHAGANQYGIDLQLAQ